VFNSGGKRRQKGVADNAYDQMKAGDSAGFNQKSHRCGMYTHRNHCTTTTAPHRTAPQPLHCGLLFTAKEPNGRGWE